MCAYSISLLFLFDLVVSVVNALISCVSLRAVWLKSTGSCWGQIFKNTLKYIFHFFKRIDSCLKQLVFGALLRAYHQFSETSALLLMATRGSLRQWVHAHKHPRQCFWVHGRNKPTLTERIQDWKFAWLGAWPLWLTWLNNLVMLLLVTSSQDQTQDLCLYTYGSLLPVFNLFVILKILICEWKLLLVGLQMDLLTFK